MDSRLNASSIGEFESFLDETALRKAAKAVGLTVTSNGTSKNQVGVQEGILTEDDIKRIIFAWDKDEDGVIGVEDFEIGMTETMLPD